MNTPTRPRWIDAFCRNDAFDHSISRIELIETHISWVVLTGDYAYKIKKPVNLGFLDFTTLDARHRFCDEELRLNLRLAPQLYLEIAAIVGSADAPRAFGNGNVLDYAVKMREFPQSALAGRLLADNALSRAQMDAFAAKVAAFHTKADVAKRGSPYGAPEEIIASARENFVQIAHLLSDSTDQTHIAELSAWTEQEYNTTAPLFAARLTDGYIRECHGDLHLGNIVRLDGQLVPFDCIEFNPTLRWIDVMSEVAFLVMDLMDHESSDLATRFLNVYLECTGDYAGLATLRFYLVYRALVRAKVHALRAAQSSMDTEEHTRLRLTSRHYIGLAQRLAQHQRPAFILMRGLSGSGKSVIGQAIAEQTSAICVRSDIERKRLRGLAPLSHSGSALSAGLYTEDHTVATYNQLLEQARKSTIAGYGVLVDATFLKRWQRDLFRREAQTLGTPFVIVEVSAPEATLRTRISARTAAANDASEANQAVLSRQLAESEALTCEELTAVVRVNTTHDDVPSITRETCRLLREKLEVPCVAPARTRPLE